MKSKDIQYRALDLRPVRTCIRRMKARGIYDGQRIGITEVSFRTYSAGEIVLFRETQSEEFEGRLMIIERPVTAPMRGGALTERKEENIPYGYVREILF